VVRGVIWVLAMLASLSLGAASRCNPGRRRDRVCKRRAGFTGNRLHGARSAKEAGRKPIRSAPRAGPKPPGMPVFEPVSNGAGSRGHGDEVLAHARDQGMGLGMVVRQD